MHNIEIKRKKLQNAVMLTFVIWAAAMVAKASPTGSEDRNAGLFSSIMPAAGGIASHISLSEPKTLALLRYGLPPIPKVKPVRPAPNATLSTDAADTYRRIFALQSSGQWAQADDLMGKLSDKSLAGHVLAQRYLNPSSPRASFNQLSEWLDRYADLPDADRVYKLALSRKPKGTSASALRKPVRMDGISGYLDVFADNAADYAPAVHRTDAQDRLVERLADRIRDALGDGAPSRALTLFEKDPAAKLLDSVEYDRLQAQIASSFLFEGKRDNALQLAQAAANRSGNKAPLAGWTAGLASWRLQNYKQAAAFFEQAGNSSYASASMASAGSYWAARAHIRAGDVRGAAPWLNRAANYPHTFYGLIALRALGRDANFNWDMPEMTEAMTSRLKAIPAGARAMELVAAGQLHEAEEELGRIKPGNDKQLTDALLAYANKAGLPSLAMRLAEAVPHPGGGLYDAALYPMSPWQPQDGYKVDRALIHAIVRQESRFDPSARSHSGATGLMQLMPETATYVTGGRHTGRTGLEDPEINLAIGQHYVNSLLETQPISTDLFSLVVAYNAGPGNLRRWKDDTQAKDDPLLFIESIPVAETRTFAEKVMANYWIYRLRLKQPVPSLDAVADGHWARYVSIDTSSERADAIIKLPEEEITLFAEN